MKKILASLICFGFSTATFAGDLYEFKNLGFSKDGKYFSFMQSAELDGSGFSSARVTVVEVAKNSIVDSSNVLLKNDGATVAQAEAKALSQIRFSNFNIVPGKNLGRTLLERLNSDLSTYTSTTVRKFFGGYLSFTVTEQKDTNAKFECYFEGQESALLTLTMITEPDDNQTPIVLQQDSRVPASRACAHDYKVSHIIETDAATVVMVSYRTPGFEGRNLNFMAVTTNK
jgi:predicted secreted protein